VAPTPLLACSTRAHRHRYPCPCRKDTYDDMGTGMAEQMMRIFFNGIAVVASLWALYQYRDTGKVLVNIFIGITIVYTIMTTIALFNSTSNNGGNDFLKAYVCWFSFLALVVLPLSFNWGQAYTRYSAGKGYASVPLVEQENDDKLLNEVAVEPHVAEDEYVIMNWGHSWLTVLMLVASFVYAMFFDASLVSYSGGVEIIFPTFGVFVLLVHTVVVITETGWSLPHDQKKFGLRNMEVTNKELIFMGFVVQVMTTLVFVLLQDGSDPNNKFHGSMLNPMRSIIFVICIPKMALSNRIAYDVAQKTQKSSADILLRGSFAVARPVFFVQDDV
jgi:hypothetical protein